MSALFHLYLCGRKAAEWLIAMIDLHMHSRYSDDGEFAPEELVRQCCECDITVMSVTDHNCARANGEAEQAAQRYGIRYIPGIEIDCTYKGVDFHVLGYGIDWRSEDFASVEENIRRQCIDGSRQQLLKTQELGFQVTAQEMQQLCQGLYWKDKWTGDLFAELLLVLPRMLLQSGCRCTTVVSCSAESFPVSCP